MKSSERKCEANRLNALKSTGPKTAEGKARASQNAVKHGLTAASPVVLDEDPEAFAAFAREMTADLKPRGAIQRTLVERIVFIAWKLRRVPDVEARLLEACEGQVLHARVDEHGLRERATVCEVIAEMGCQAFFGRLQMYEMRLERSLHASLRQLERLKKTQNEANEEEDAPVEPREETNVQNEATANEDQVLSRDTDVSSVQGARDEPDLSTSPTAPRDAASSITPCVGTLAG
jgi:hypothetical protein